jgi:hypothetical protein
LSLSSTCYLSAFLIIPHQVLAKAEAEEEAQEEAVRKEAEEEALERMRMNMSSFLNASSMSTDLSATPPTKVLKTPRIHLWLAPMLRDDALAVSSASDGVDLGAEAGPLGVSGRVSGGRSLASRLLSLYAPRSSSHMGSHMSSGGESGGSIIERSSSSRSQILHPPARKLFDDADK